MIDVNVDLVNEINILANIEDGELSSSTDVWKSVGSESLGTDRSAA